MIQFINAKVDKAKLIEPFNPLVRPPNLRFEKRLQPPGSTSDPQVRKKVAPTFFGTEIRTQF